MELKALAKLYTEPSEDPSLSPVHKYYLRGVIVSKYLTYVCRRPEPELIDMGLDDKSSLSPDQWWKIHWPASVLRAAVEVSAIEHRRTFSVVTNYLSEMHRRRGPSHR